MAVRRRTLWRIFVVFLAAILILPAHYVQQRLAFEWRLHNLEQTVLPGYLEQAFPSRWFGDLPSAAPDQSSIQRRVREFNSAHWRSDAGESEDLRIAVVKAGPVSEELSPRRSFVQSIEVPVNMGNQMVEFSLVAERPKGITLMGGLFALFTLGVGFLFVRVMPHPSPVNQFPLARDMALVFDRKVSADQQWGAFRLTHLGGGGQLPGLARNDLSVCNDLEVRLACFAAIRETFEATYPHSARALQGPLQESFENTMREGFEEGERILRNQAPTIRSEADVNQSFRPFVRNQVLGFGLISFQDFEIFGALVGLKHDRIDVARPPAWLLGGYEIYYPRPFFVQLIEEVRSGIQSAYARPFDRVEVSADPTSAFITVDFIATGVALDERDADRIRQYLARPFSGGLARIVGLMHGFGWFSILDETRGFNLSQRKPRECSAHGGLVNRFEFRRIRPEELSTIRGKIHIRKDS